ncbi:DegV family protein [Pseudoglutamicibacter cumminsii]|uniref:DegV family protein n=1 Tax=Pseudoglutamicibacter cumminsii TaxID=156979 RepID=UPI0025563A08|nr:DegV family protein [Pseudoglutamicibacter cumminsii]MDZ3745722.1 DegV family protein [Pseudoglutamicibacter cumminsii]
MSDRLSSLARRLPASLERQPGRGQPRLGHRIAALARAYSGRRPRTWIITDSAAGLSDEVVASYRGYLSVVPMHVTVGGQVYNDGDPDLQQALAMGFALGQSVSTSRPAPGKFREAYDHAVENGAERIIVITMAGKLSNTADSARLAAEQSAVDVEVIDSCSAGFGQALAVVSAADAAMTGRDPVEAAQHAMGSHIWLTVPSLDALRKGGRVTITASVLGNLLSIRPILRFDASGSISVLERVRHTDRALQRLAELGIEHVSEAEPGDVQVAVQHFAAEEAAIEVADALEPHTSWPVTISPLPAVLAAHCGPGAIGLVVHRFMHSKTDD